MLNFVFIILIVIMLLTEPNTLLIKKALIQGPRRGLWKKKTVNLLKYISRYEKYIHGIIVLPRV